MGETYSFSRIEMFETCKLQYRYDYIDEIKSGIENIDSFMGSRVHDALKEFYDLVKNRVIKPKEWLTNKYEELWQKNYDDSIRIVKRELSAEDYYQKGKAALIDYYDEYKPFDQTRIIETEKLIRFQIEQNDKEFIIVGKLDRIDWNDKAKRFEIHDYKSSGNLKTQEEADSDDQLTLYQIALMQLWPDAFGARLIWHYLLFNKEIESSRAQEQLQAFQEILVRKIQDIEDCKDFPPKKSPLCPWCGYQDICPLWKHPKAMERLEVNEYKKDPGVVLVRKYAELEARKGELKNQIKAIEDEQAKIGEAAIEYAERERVRVIDGPDHQLAVTIKEESKAPTRQENQENWQKLRDTLIAEGRFIEVSTINTNMLNSRIRTWPKDFYEKIKDFLINRVIKKVELKPKRSA